MFVLHPDGPSGGGGLGGAPGGSGSHMEKVYFFGKLGIYFGILHALSWYMSPTETAKAIIVADKSS
jgi:hypothetical protein